MMMVLQLLKTLLDDPRWQPAWRLLWLALVTVICWLAFSPHPPQGADLGWDKANHAAAFATLAMVGLQCLRSRWRPLWVLLALLGYGVLIELVQSRIPGREADAMDVLADMVGAAIGLAVHALLAWLIRRAAAHRAAA